MSKLEPKTKERLLTVGRELAALIETQTQRCAQVLQNREEYRRLESLKTKWEAWEQEAKAAGIDVEQEFGEKLKILRPLVLKVNPFQRRTLNAFEAHVIGSRQPESLRPSDPNITDSGLFSGQAKWR